MGPPLNRSSLFVSPGVHASALPTFVPEYRGAAETEQQCFKTTPNCLPTRFAIAFAAEEAAEARQAAEEVTHALDRFALLCQPRQSCQPIGRDNIGGGTFRVLASDHFQLEQANRQDTQQPN